MRIGSGGSFGDNGAGGPGGFDHGEPGAARCNGRVTLPSRSANSFSACRVCSSESSTCAPHIRHSASRSHRRMLIGAPQSGHAQESTSPSSQTCDGAEKPRRPGRPAANESPRSKRSAEESRPATDDMSDNSESRKKGDSPSVYTSRSPGPVRKNGKPVNCHDVAIR